MAMTNIGRQFRGKADVKIKEMADFLAGGAAKDFAEYRYYVGYIAGINEAIAILEELEKD